ncbi:MAG: PAS domain-containing protein [Nitrospirae bacterium]|nr:PAS domain-containing protein [Nitrospirota bacterium]
MPLHDLIRDIVSRGIFEGIGDAVSIQDTEFRIVYQNDKAKAIIGDHVGEYCYKAIEHREGVCENCPLALTLEDGMVRTAERQNPVIDPPLIVEITTSALRDPSGEIIAGTEVVRNVTDRKMLEKEKEKLIRDLAEALSAVKTLRGLLPLCASCKKIRDDKGYWMQVDEYISEHSEAEITHGYCPECERKHFPSNFK